MRCSKAANERQCYKKNKVPFSTLEYIYIKKGYYAREKFHVWDS
jgi:hypothetical protein